MPTQHVDPSSSEQLQDVANALLKSRKVVVITGAGISTNSGIPDFRSENGLYALIQAQFDAAQTNVSQQDTPSQTESDTDHSSLEEDAPARKRRRLSNQDTIEVHEKEEDSDDQKTIEIRADSITVCQSPEPSSADTSMELPSSCSIQSKEEVIVCTPQPVRTAIQVAMPDSSSPLSSPPQEDFMISSSFGTQSPPSTIQSLRQTRVSELSIHTSSSPLSSPPACLYDDPFRTQPLSDSSPSRRSSTASDSDMDDTLGTKLFNASQASLPTRTNLPNMKGKDLFDANIWSDPLRTSVFYTFATSLRQKIRACEPTTSHRFISHLRDRGKLVRCYTQNIDRIEEKVGLSTSLQDGPGSKARFSRRSTANVNQLSKMVEEANSTKDLPATQGPTPSQSQSEDGTKTPTEGDSQTESSKPPKLEPSRSSGVECVFLHGSLECLRCFRCGLNTSWDDYREMETMSGLQPECPHCIGATVAREERGKRALGVGKLRPDIVLYGEEHPDAHLIGPIVTHDISLCPDILLILGTSLRVHGLKVIVRQFANAIHNRGGKVVFVNFTKPPESSWGDFIDYWVQWDCDAWVDDLQTRVPKLWEAPQPPKEKAPAKNPVAMRDSRANGAWCTSKIFGELGRITGSPTLTRSNSEADLRKPAKAPKKSESRLPAEETIQVQTTVTESTVTETSPTGAIVVKEETKITATPEACVVEATIEVSENPKLAKKATKPKGSRKSAPGALERPKKKPPSTLNPNHGRASKNVPRLLPTTPSTDSIEPPSSSPGRDIASAVGSILQAVQDNPRADKGSILQSVKVNPRVRKPKKPFGEDGKLLEGESRRRNSSKNEPRQSEPKSSPKSDPPKKAPPKRKAPESKTPRNRNKRLKTEQDQIHAELTLAPLKNTEPLTPPQLDLRPQPVEPRSPPSGPDNSLPTNIRPRTAHISTDLIREIDSGRRVAKEAQAFFDRSFQWSPHSPQNARSQPEEDAALGMMKMRNLNLWSILPNLPGLGPVARLLQ